MTLSIADLAEYEQKPLRRHYRHMGHYVEMRVYDISVDLVPILPLAGAFFPGETTGPCITADGVQVSPASDGENMRIAITATAPIYIGQTGSGSAGGETFTYGL